MVMSREDIDLAGLPVGVGVGGLDIVAFLSLPYFPLCRGFPRENNVERTKRRKVAIKKKLNLDYWEKSIIYRTATGKK